MDVAIIIHIVNLAHMVTGQNCHPTYICDHLLISWSFLIITMQVPCHTESELIEVFNELAVVFNISDTEVNETCFYVKEGNSSHSEDHHKGEDDHDQEGEDDHNQEGEDDHNQEGEDDHDHMEEEEEDHDHKEDGHEEEVSPFCANMYSMIREMVLTLNYTTPSCLINGTTGSSTGDPEVSSTRSDPALGVLIFTNKFGVLFARAHILLCNMCV